MKKDIHIGFKIINIFRYVLSFGKKIKLINTAISQNKKINFNYRKFSGEKSKRTISPETTNIIRRTWCVGGFCYLRNEDRTFAIKRMRNLKIMGDDKS